MFINGDVILHHSTGIHGMFLLASLPIFIYGIYKSISGKNEFIIFLISCFLIGPLLLGFVGSIHRASRIIFLTPFFCLICAYGFLKFWEIKNQIFRICTVIFCLVFTFNFFDFARYYLFQYPNDTYHIFYSPVSINAYKQLEEVSKKDNLEPLVSSENKNFNQGSKLETGIENYYLYIKR